MIPYMPCIDRRAAHWVQWSTTLCWAVWRCLADGRSSLVMAQGDPAYLTFALMEGYGVLQVPRQGGHTWIGWPTGRSTFGNHQLSQGGGP